MTEQIMSWTSSSSLAWNNISGSTDIGRNREALPAVSLTQATGILALVYLLYILFKYRKRAVGTNERPDLITKAGWPLMGNLPWMITTAPRCLEHQIALRRELGAEKRYTAISATVPWRRLIMLSNPSHVEHIQKTNFANYEKGALFGEVMTDVLGAGIFVVDGDKWLMQRKTTSHIFNVHTFRGSISSAIREHVAIFHQLLVSHSESGEPLDLSNTFFRFTLDSFVKMGFGQNLHSLSPVSPQPSVPFAEAFDHAQRRMASRFGNPFWSLEESFTIPFTGITFQTKVGQEMEHAKRTMFNFCDSVISQKKEQAEVCEKEKPDEMDPERKGQKDLLSLYMDIKDANGERLSQEQLKEIILNLIIAGRDTTAQALSWCFFHLIKNQRLMEPIRQEALEQLGADGEVTYDNYKSLKQALSVFYETLRLHPSVPKNAKVAVDADQIPDGGPRIEKGDIVHWSDWEIGRDTLLWGEDSLEFRPSRWIEEKGDVKRETQWKFHAFNGGPRLCLGQNLATFEAVSAIVVLVRSFDFTFAPAWYESVPKSENIARGNVEEGVPLYEMSLTLPMRSPLQVNVRQRSSA